MLHSLRAFTSRIWPRLGLLALQELDERVLSFLKLAGKGADKNKASEDGFTPLIRASFANHVEVVRLLIDAGADKDSVTRDHLGLSALHFAAVNNYVGTARLLVEAGADQSVQSSHEDRTALDLAVLQGHTEIVELLSI